MIAYQFSNVIVGKNELREAGQSLFKSLTDPTEERTKIQRFNLVWKLEMVKTHKYENRELLS